MILSSTDAEACGCRCSVVLGASWHVRYGAGSQFDRTTKLAQGRNNEYETSSKCI